MSSSPDASAPFITSPIVQVSVVLPVTESSSEVGDTTVAVIPVLVSVEVTLTNSIPTGNTSVSVTFFVVPLVNVTTVW